MKAITLWQPWAGAMALGLKKNETRGRRFNYRGELAIHAGYHEPSLDELRPVTEAILRGDARRLTGNMNPIGLAKECGAILCVVELWACVYAEYMTTGGVGNPTGQQISTLERSLGDYSPGRYALLTRRLRVLRSPVPCRGFQVVPWTVPPEVEAEVRRQMP